MSKTISSLFNNMQRITKPKRVIGLEIGNSNIKLLECTKKDNQLIIENTQIITTPSESVEDGIIVDSQRVYEAIVEELESKKYKAKNMVVVIKSSQIITRDIRVMAMPKRDLDVLLEIQYPEYLMVDISQYQITYKVIRQIDDGENKEQEILIVAAPNTMINPLLEVTKKLKVRVRAINIASDSVANIFSKKREIADGENNEVMVVDIGGKSTTVTIVVGGVAVLNRDIPFGLDTINPLIMREIKQDNPEKIEEFKEQYAGIYKENELGEHIQYISSIIKPMLEYQLVSELKRFLQFHYSRNKNRSINKAYIIGGGAYLKNIEQYMTQALGIRCISGIGFDREYVEFGKEFEEKSAYFANILGLVSEF